MSRELARARRALAWERAVPVWAPALGLLAAWMALGAWGALDGLPRGLASGLAATVWLAALLLVARGLRAGPWPDEAAARARLQADAGLGEHGALAALADRPAGGDAATLALWRAAQARARAAAHAARARGPRPALARLDRLGLRFLAPAALLAAVWIYGTDAARRAPAALAVDVGAMLGDAPLAIEAWAVPPAYSGQPPVRLTGREGETLSLLDGSVVTVRVDGPVGAPALSAPGARVRFTPDGAQAWRARVTPQRDGAVVVARFGARARWMVRLTPDAPPAAQFVQPPQVAPGARLALSAAASDDIAVAALALRLTLVDPPQGLEGAPPRDVPLPLTPGPAVRERATLDMAADPWAGLAVSAQVAARDGKGQEALSAAVHLVLPERAFRSGMAQALVEQRRILLQDARPYDARAVRFADRSFDPESWRRGDRLAAAPPGVRRAAALLAAFLDQPQGYFTDPAVFLTLSTAAAMISAARTTEEAHKAADLLWRAALRADQDGQGDGADALSAARDALADALRRGAPADELRALMDRLREALGARLEELAREAAARGDQAPQPGENALSGEDLQGLLDRLEDAAELGARAEAQALLDQLSGIMQGLSVTLGEGAGQGPGQGGGQGGGAQRALDDTLQRQRELTDETFRRGQEGRDPSDLTGGQETLSRAAEALGQEARETSPDAAARLEEAAEAMDRAAGALRRGDADAAQAAQGEAQQALRAAGEALARDSAAAAPPRDPLGRLTGPGGLDDGDGVRVPTEGERRRARAVLEELRRRANDPGRPREEREYLERLLDSFGS